MCETASSSLLLVVKISICPIVGQEELSFLEPQSRSFRDSNILYLGVVNTLTLIDYPLISKTGILSPSLFRYKKLRILSHKQSDERRSTPF